MPKLPPRPTANGRPPPPRDWMKYIGSFGKFDVERLAADVGGIDGMRELLKAGDIVGVWRAEVASWVREREGEADAERAERQTVAAEKQAASAADAVRISRWALGISFFAFLVALGALGAQIWPLIFPPTH